MVRVDAVLPLGDLFLGYQESYGNYWVLPSGEKIDVGEVSIGNIRAFEDAAQGRGIKGGSPDQVMENALKAGWIKLLDYPPTGFLYLESWGADDNALKNLESFAREYWKSQDGVVEFVMRGEVRGTSATKLTLLKEEFSKVPSFKEAVILKLQNAGIKTTAAGSDLKAAAEGFVKALESEFGTIAEELGLLTPAEAIRKLAVLQADVTSRIQDIREGQKVSGERWLDAEGKLISLHNNVGAAFRGVVRSLDEPSYKALSTEIERLARVTFAKKFGRDDFKPISSYLRLMPETTLFEMPKGTIPLGHQFGTHPNWFEWIDRVEAFRTMKSSYPEGEAIPRAIEKEVFDLSKPKEWIYEFSFMKEQPRRVIPRPGAKVLGSKGPVPRPPAVRRPMEVSTTRPEFKGFGYLSQVGPEGEARFNRFDASVDSLLNSLPVREQFEVSHGFAQGAELYRAYKAEEIKEADFIKRLDEIEAGFPPAPPSSLPWILAILGVLGVAAIVFFISKKSR